MAIEIGILTALGREPRVPFLPEVVASSTDPVLLVTRLVPGASLFEAIDSIDPGRAGQQLARFLAALHHRRRASAPRPPSARSPAGLPRATTAALRERFMPLARPLQRQNITRWCDWANAVLTSPGPAVPVHGDLHGNNQLVDLETAGAAEPC